MTKISNNCKPILFADDTNLIFYDNTILNLKDKMQTDINKLFKWLNINKLSIHIYKTNVLLFNIRNKNENINLNLYINNIKLKQVTGIKIVGVYIDDKLNWKKQINYIATQLCRAIAILNKVKHKFDIKTLILLYNSFFYSHLNYCVHIWEIIVCLFYKNNYYTKSSVKIHVRLIVIIIINCIQHSTF